MSNHPSSPIEARYSSVKKLLELGRIKGYLLEDEIFDHLPQEVSSLPEEILVLFARLDELGIAVISRPERYEHSAELETSVPDLETPNAI